MDVVDLARELVSCESVTTREGPVAALVADRLEAQGWSVVRQPIDGADPSLSQPRVNVLATDPRDDPDAAPAVVLTTHLDTVPPHIPPTEDDEFLYGRGTCDAKGIFAAQWLAAERLRAAGHRGIALLGVVGEETDSIGAKAAHRVLPKADWIVDGEPTGSILASAAKGVLAVRLSVEGVAAHSAYPDRGRSAVHPLIRALHRWLEAELPGGDPFGPTTVNVGKVTGGVAPNILAPAAEASCVIRLGAPVATVRAELERLAGEGVSIEVNTASDPRRIFVPDGYEAAPVSFGSDVPHLSSIGTPLLVGPGSIHDAHTAGEKIGKRALRDAVDFYVELVERLLRAGRGDIRRT